MYLSIVCIIRYKRMHLFYNKKRRKTFLVCHIFQDLQSMPKVFPPLFINQPNMLIIGIPITQYQNDKNIPCRAVPRHTTVNYIIGQLLVMNMSAPVRTCGCGVRCGNFWYLYVRVGCSAEIQKYVFRTRTFENVISATFPGLF